MKISAVSFILLFLCSSPSWSQTATFTLRELTPEPASADAHSVGDIQAKVADAYARCHTYQDSGMVETRFHEGEGSLRIVQRSFATVFVRPDRFRFEFKEDDSPWNAQRYIIGRTGVTTRSWWSLDSEEKHPDSLETALAGATGVSGGSAYTVPMMLIATELQDGWSKRGLSKTIRIADAALNGVPCYRLQWVRKSEAKDMTVGGETHHMPTTSSREVFWIDQKTSLIVRIDEITDFGGFWTSGTTTYSPRMNQTIPDSAFVFRP